VLQTDQRWATWIVGALVAMALVTALVLIGVAQRSEGSGAVTPEPAASTTTPPATTAPVTTTPRPLVAGEVAIVSAAEFDPEPGDGKEHPEQLGRLTDGRGETAWSTSCYRQPTMAPKKGVGLVFRLSAPAAGTALRLDTPSRGWSASVFVADDVGGRLRDWGSPVTTVEDAGPGTVELALGDATGRFVLLWFTDLGEPACEALPHQVRVGEVRVVQD
jgi:hypothetical protein